MRDSSSILCLMLCLAGCAGQADPAQRLAEAFLARESIGVVRPDMTLDAAYALQNAYVEHLSATLGGGGGRVQGGPDEPGDAGTVRRGASAVRRVAGGDAAPLRQRRPGRLRGAPLYEGDLIARVGSDAINRAETDDELLAALDAVVPFLELPDLMYTPEAALDGPAIVSINVGGRLGIVGEPVPLPDSAAYAWLAGIHVEVSDVGGQVLAEGGSDALLGHPLNVVRWLRDALREAGKPLEPGMLLSLDSVTALV